jgi:hypothetical protein
MTRPEASRELGRSASTLLRNSGNDPTQTGRSSRSARTYWTGQLPRKSSRLEGR